MSDWKKTFAAKYERPEEVAKRDEERRAAVDAAMAKLLDDAWRETVTTLKWMAEQAQVSFLDGDTDVSLELNGKTVSAQLKRDAGRFVVTAGGVAQVYVSNRAMGCVTRDSGDRKKILSIMDDVGSFVTDTLVRQR